MGASSGARPNNSSPGGNRTKVYGTKFPRTGRWVIWNRDNQGEALDMKAGKAGDRVSIPTLCCLFSWLLFWKPISRSSRSKTLSLWNYGLMTKGCSKANGLWRILRTSPFGLVRCTPKPHPPASNSSAFSLDLSQMLGGIIGSNIFTRKIGWNCCFQYDESLVLILSPKRQNLNEEILGDLGE